MPWYQPLLDRWPDFAVTLGGVLFGALLALWIERGVAHWQLRRQREAEERRNHEYLLSHVDRLKFEIRDNAATVRHLQYFLEKSPHARVDLFRLAGKSVATLSISAYEDLVRSGLQQLLPEEIQSDFFDARQRTVGLKAMVEAGEPAVEFYLGYGVDQKSADLHLENVKTYSQTVFDGLERAKNMAYEIADSLRKQLKSR